MKTILRSKPNQPLRAYRQSIPNIHNDRLQCNTKQGNDFANQHKKCAMCILSLRMQMQGLTIAHAVLSNLFEMYAAQIRMSMR